ncbi:hypothetical protein GCM10023085_16810 [Actinomadura viridis]|uniref:Extradiol ring-cleavage dioxygenase LigAB LigA subunit domain-containing protein n=1 Tax=Actinomadura viridis TaxID=58110 RepID=A0A931DMW9_9ACTN|nr:hypothetical protein [Actinomadura viridis]MBG6089558.1 hypothetical protein [Actinomadura viridis]
MSIVGLNRLARDLEHVPGLLGRFEADPRTVLSAYPLTTGEREAVTGRDSGRLLAHGMNPVALRNLMVVLGVPHGAMYAAHDADGHRHDGR